MTANILIETEGITKEQWLAARQCGIGGSDVAPLLGISPWKSAYELWCEKTNDRVEPVQEDESMMWGTLLEPVIRQHFAKVTGKPVVEVKAILQHPEYPFMLADVDGITTDDEENPAILEIKTTSEYKRSDWESGVPAFYEVQVQHYLSVTGLKTAYVAVLIGGNTFKVFEVTADEEVQRALIAIEADFWRMVENGIRPEIDGSDTAADWLNRTFKGGDKTEITLPDEAAKLIDDYIAASAKEDSAKAEKQTAANRLKEMMKDHTKALCAGHVISWNTVTSQRFDTKAFEAAEPELYQRYIKPSVSRRFTVK